MKKEDSDTNRRRAIVKGNKSRILGSLVGLIKVCTSCPGGLWIIATRLERLVGWMSLEALKSSKEFTLTNRSIWHIPQHLWLEAIECWTWYRCAHKFMEPWSC